MSGVRAPSWVDGSEPEVGRRARLSHPGAEGGAGLARPASRRSPEECLQERAGAAEEKPAEILRVSALVRSGSVAFLQARDRRLVDLTRDLKPAVGLGLEQDQR